jgi:hypothetical protein
MGKLLIMATASNAPNLPTTPGEPLSNAEVLLQISYGLAEIRDNLGEMRRAVEILEDARKTYDERILQLIKTTTATDSALPGLKSTIDRHSADLNGLGKIAHSAQFFGKIALVLLGSVVGIAISVVTFLYHHLVFK